MFWMWYSQNWGFPCGSAVNNQSAMQEMQVQSLGWEDNLEEEIKTHSSIVAWEIPQTEGPGKLRPWGHKEQDTTEKAHTHTHTNG